MPKPALFTQYSSAVQPVPCCYSTEDHLGLARKAGMMGRVVGRHKKVISELSLSNKHS
jgi:hypothetical protein